MDLEYVDEGRFGRVYRLEDQALKFLRGNLNGRIDNEEASELLSAEYGKQLFLYESGISVPRPLGIHGHYVQRDTSVKRPGIHPALAMEFIPNVDFALLDEGNKKKAVKNFERELERAWRYAKAISSEDAEINFLYIPKEDKVVLIDFDLWVVPGVQ